MDYVKNPMGIAEKAMRDYGVDIMSVHDVVMGLCISTFGASTRALGSSSQTLRVAGLAAYPYGAVDQPFIMKAAQSHFGSTRRSGRPP